MKISFSSNKKNDATVENNVRIPYGAAKRAFPQIRWLIILIFVASPFFIFLGKIVVDWVFVTSPGTVWMEKRTINAIEAGTVEKAFYRRGDIAGADTVIFRVKRRMPENRREQLALLEAEREAASIGAIAGERQLTSESVAYYQQLRDNTKWLLEQGAATRAEMDLAENKLWEVKAAVGFAYAAPAVNPVRVAQVEQSIKSLQKITEEFFEIKAGQGGKVSSILVSEGQSFAAGEPLAVVMNTEQAYIVTYVDPSNFKKINMGTVATVKMLGTGRKIKAVVEQSPGTAGSVPTGISEKIYPITMRGVQLFLKVTEPLQEEEAIDGLPVVVEW